MQYHISDSSDIAYRHQSYGNRSGRAGDFEFIKCRQLEHYDQRWLYSEFGVRFARYVNRWRDIWDGVRNSSDTSGNCKPFTKTYTIDSPTASSYVTASGVYHHQNIADIGMYSDVYLAPDTVSFQWLYYREQQATFSANGSWICENGLGHETALTSVAVGSDYPGFGSKVDAQDWDFSGSCTGNQIQTSTETVYIPTQYALASDSAIWYSITTVTQSATEDASGNLNLTKTGGASVSTSVSSATSGF